MTKTQLWAEVQALLVEQKASKKLAQALEDLLAPKSGGGQTNPPKEIDGVMHYYCRFHQAYEPETNMVMSLGKSKGYCKASISKWNKMNSDIKKLNSQAVIAMSEGLMDDAQAYAKESEALKAILNAPESYSLEQDWLDFNKVVTSEE